MKHLSLKILIPTLLLFLQVFAEKKDCIEPALTEGRNLAIKSYLSENDGKLKDLIIEDLPYDGGQFGDCCWTIKKLKISHKEYEQAKVYIISAGNSYGDYEKGICKLSIGKRGIKMPDIKNKAAECLIQAQSWAEKSIDQLAVAEVAANQYRSESFVFDVKLDNKSKGKLFLSKLECQFEGFEL